MTFYKIDNNINKINPKDIKLFVMKKNYTNRPHLSHSICSKVNQLKSKIEGVDEWDNMKKYTNVYEYIHTLAPNYNVSISKIKPISRAFFKLVEIINSLDILENYKFTPINTFHLAEGPGGFIEATSYLRKMKNDKYYGMTLINEKNENVPGWHKITELLTKQSNIIIETGTDKTGDMFSIENFKHCYEKYSNSMDLITADGGFDFSVDFNKQEQMASNLILVEALYTIIMQKKDGNCIIKMYDIFTKYSIDIIYLLSSFYKELYVTKPSTSRTANSERYIVCKTFKFDSTKEYYNIFKKLLEYLKVNPNYTIISFLEKEIPYKFSLSLEEINAIISTQQINNIQATLKLINGDKTNEKLNKLKENNIQKCISWCIKNNIPYNNIENTINQFRTTSHKNCFI